MYVQGVSTRKVKAITEELCGHAFSASSISAINKRLDESPQRPLPSAPGEPFPYLILDARYEKVREGGVVMSQAVLIAVGVDWDGRRQILAVEMANRESRSSWKDFLLGLRRRGLNGVEFVVADDHAGLRAAIREVLPEAPSATFAGAVMQRSANSDLFRPPIPINSRPPRRGSPRPACGLVDKALRH